MRATRNLADDLPPDEPSDLDLEPDEPSDLSDLDYEDIPCTDDGDDGRWDVFIPDDDEWDPEPNRGDFWQDDRRDGRPRGELSGFPMCDSIV